MNKKVIIISVAVIVIAVTALVAFRMMSGSGTTFYTDEHIKGNTSCNLLNGGLFCEVDNTIYFSNPNARGALYSMTSDLKRMKLVFPDNASYINAAGPYIFYTKRNDKKPIDSDAMFAFNSTGLYRLSRSGSQNIVLLSEHTTQTACLYGNYIYYQHYDKELGFILYAAKIDASEDKKLLEDSCTPTAVDNSTIYYTGIKKDHNMHSISTNGENNSVLLEGNFVKLAKQGNYLYFLDMDANYQLKRMPVDGGMVETLVKDRVFTYNVSPNEDVLYCQIDNGSDNGLYELNLSTLSMTKIAEGDFNYLHLTKNYLFYEEYNQSNVYVLNLATRTTRELELPDGIQ